MLRNLLTTSVRSGMSRVAASTSMTRVAPALVAPTTMSLRFQNQKINADELKVISMYQCSLGVDRGVIFMFSMSKLQLYLGRHTSDYVPT